ncbi:MAG: hypothetical protein C4576_14225 [Desulfobacteraceae bacterium]|nr:MAG: hypothetical protein C4576_14225 [Desulfobacteraceae bacterium]
MAIEITRPSAVYNLMFHAGEVTEIRAIGGLQGKNKAWEGTCWGAKGVVSGYFDNVGDFGRAAEALDNAGAHGVYFCLNPCKESLLARAENRLKAGINTTSDRDVKMIRWLPIDLDPVRPSGISSTEEEVEQAFALATEVMAWINELCGWEKPLRGFSGNGCHLLFRLLDLANTDENVLKIKKALAAAAHQFSGRTVLVDESVFNPSRIWKVYGTMARKGDNTKSRPHRKSMLISKEQILTEVEICK